MYYILYIYITAVGREPGSTHDTITVCDDDYDDDDIYVQYILYDLHRRRRRQRRH